METADTRTHSSLINKNEKVLCATNPKFICSPTIDNSFGSKADPSREVSEKVKENFYIIKLELVGNVDSNLTGPKAGPIGNRNIYTAGSRNETIITIIVKKTEVGGENAMIARTTTPPRGLCVLQRNK